MCGISQISVYHFHPDGIQKLQIIFDCQHPLPSLLILRVFPHGLNVVLVNTSTSTIINKGHLRGEPWSIMTNFEEMVIRAVAQFRRQKDVVEKGPELLNGAHIHHMTHM